MTATLGDGGGVHHQARRTQRERRRIGGVLEKMSGSVSKLDAAGKTHV